MAKVHTAQTKDSPAPKQGRLKRFTKVHEIREHLSQKDRLYRFLFFMSFALNVIWVVIVLMICLALKTGSLDNLIINAGLTRYCDPKGVVARQYEDTVEIGGVTNLHQRICLGGTPPAQ